eukprot:11402262-Karenia_brevis.AAC.1
MSLGNASKALAAAELALQAKADFAKAHARRALALESLNLPAWAAADAAVQCAEYNNENSAFYKRLRERFSSELKN